MVKFLFFTVIVVACVMVIMNPVKSTLMPGAALCLVSVAGFFASSMSYKKARSLEEQLSVDKENFDEQIVKTKHDLKQAGKRITARIGSMCRCFQELVIARDEDALYNALRSLLANNIKVSSFTFFLVDKDDTLKVKNSYSKDGHVKPGILVSRGDNNIMGFVAEKGMTLSTLGLERDRSLSALFEKLPIECLVCLPIKVENQTIGVLNVESFVDGTYSKDELVMLETAVFFLGLSIELRKVGYRF